MRKPSSQAVKKHVCYVEGPIAPRFYDVEETVKQSADACVDLVPQSEAAEAVLKAMEAFARLSTW